MGGEKSNGKEEVTYKPSSNEKQEFLVPERDARGKTPFFLYFVVLTADILPLVGGVAFIWSSPVIPKLKSTDPSINPLGTPITALQESWIASLPALGGAIGPLLIGRLADTYGRKKALIFVTLLQLVSFVILAFATNINVYYVTRFLVGVGAGMTFTILPSYIAETCEVRNRGTFGCIMGVLVAIGALYTIVVGPFLSIKWFTLTCVPPLIYLMVCLVLVIPESPAYLASVGRDEEARRTLMKLKNKDRQGVEKDLLEIHELIEHSSQSSKGGYLDLVKTSALRKALVICVGLPSLQQFSGVTAILAFIQPVFKMTGGGIPPNTAAILVLSVKVIGVVVASAVVEKVGRKFLLLSSTISCAVSLIALSVYFHLKRVEFEHLDVLFWLPITTLMVFIFSYNVGLGPVPWALTSEIFPSSLKATAGSLTTTSCSLTAFLVTFVFPILMEYVGPANSFCFFSGFCILGAVFIYFIVPETKGKNIVEIQRELAGEKK